MKVLNKITPYSIKRAVPVLGMAFATMLGGCKKHETPEPKPTPKFERTFVWGKTISSKDLAGIVAASADSVQVVKIVLQCDGKDWGGNSDVSQIITNKLNPIFDACGKNQSKITHTGNIDRPRMRIDTPELYKSQQADSAKLVKMGYTITDPIYKDNGR